MFSGIQLRHGEHERLGYQLQKNITLTRGLSMGVSLVCDRLSRRFRCQNRTEVRQMGRG